MRRWKKICDSYFEDLKMDAYREGYAKSHMLITLRISLMDAKNGKITKQEMRELLNKICPGWSEEDICKFVYSEEGSPDREAGYERMKRDSTDLWMKCLDEGKEAYMESSAMRDRCGELQNKIVDYAEKEELFVNSILKEQYYYGAVITIARRIQEDKNSYLINVAYSMDGRLSLLNEQEIMQIDQILKDAKFGEYKGSKKAEYEYKQEANEETLRDAIVELIYKIYIKNKQKNDEIKKLMQEAIDTIDLFRIRCDIKASLQEHIDRMEAIFDKDIYPVDVILQMLGYPALSREEYNQRVAAMKKEVEWL